MNSKKLSKSRVLIIGCGDLGRRLASRLPNAHYQITGLRRRPPSGESPVLHYRSCDVSDPGALEQIVAEGYEIIVITMTPDERSDEGYQRAYVATCKNLVASLQRQHQIPGLILFTSSTAVYGQQDGSWVDEDSPTEPEGFSGKRLLEAEQIIKDSDFAHCLVRFSGIYGPGRERLINQVRQGRGVLSAAFTNRIHADDCAGVLAHILERQRQGLAISPVYIATDSAPAPMAEVVNWLAMQLRLDHAIFAPDQQDERGNKRCSNQRLLMSGYQFRYPDYRAGYREILQNYL